MPTNRPRYTIIVDDELLNQIDDFRFNNRFPSRSAATRALLHQGIEQFNTEFKDKEDSHNS